MASRNGSQAGRGVADAKIVSGVSIRRGWPHSTLKSALTLCFMQNRTQSAVKLDKEPYRYKKPTWSYVGIAGITKRSTPRASTTVLFPLVSPTAVSPPQLVFGQRHGKPFHHPYHRASSYLRAFVLG